LTSGKQEQKYERLLRHKCFLEDNRIIIIRKQQIINGRVVCATPAFCFTIQNTSTQQFYGISFVANVVFMPLRTHLGA